MYPPELTFEEKLHLEETTWHWFPYRHLHYKVDENGVKYEVSPLDIDCDEEHSINDFPGPVLTSESILKYSFNYSFIYH